MGVSSFFVSVLVGVLSAFLSFSESAEKLVVFGLEKVGYEITAVDTPIPLVETAETTPKERAEELSVVPSVFEGQEYGGPIPDILLTTLKSQRATIILAPKTESDEETATEPREPTASKTTSAPTDAIVNIFCTMRTKNEVRATTGSGAFIHKNGVILTNAHIAQFLLLEDTKNGVTTKCTVRTGTPAVPRYYADLLYIPPLWVNENAKELRSETPSGTGERDYALLYITEAIIGELPATFPALRPDTSPLKNAAKNQAVLAAGFPAEIIRTEGPKASLNPVVATTTITELFTYTKNKVDLIGIAPSVVGEQGSSGGPIVTLEGTIIGMIATRGNAEKDGAKSLRAITLAYIDRTIREETGVGLFETISGNVEERAKGFREIMTPLLSGIIADSLKQN